MKIDVPIAVKMKVNNLAAILYSMNGYVLLKGHDFSKSKHPQEYLAWNQALVACSFVEQDDWYLQFQVTRGEK